MNVAKETCSQFKPNEITFSVALAGYKRETVSMILYLHGLFVIHKSHKYYYIFCQHTKFFHPDLLAVSLHSPQNWQCYFWNPLIMLRTQSNSGLEKGVNRAMQLCILSALLLELDEYFITEHSLLRKTELFMVWANSIKRILLKRKVLITWITSYNLLLFWFLEEINNLYLTQLTIVTLCLAA